MKVSACIITYNQEDYIAQCLDGALFQIVDFEYEIVIGDDKSTDGTLDICKKYAEKYPTKIRLIAREQNLGMMGNWIKTLTACHGKYIAICEGDDYWTDPLKLQKQVDFLESNEDYVLICSNAENAYQDIECKDVNVFDILQHNPIRTLTTMFRSSALKDFITKDRMMGDLQLWLHIVKFGKMRFLTESTAYYRVLENSASARNDLNKQIDFIIDRITTTKENLKDFELSAQQRKRIIQDQYSVLIIKSLKKNKRLAFKFYIESIASAGQFNLLDLKLLKNFW